MFWPFTEFADPCFIITSPFKDGETEASKA